MTQAELNALPRVTPTGLAEQRYAQKQPSRAKRMAVGPSGLEIPAPRAVFRPTVDGPLLNKIATTALGADARHKLDDDRKAVTEALRADVLARFPADEMIVLYKHGFAQITRSLSAEVEGYRMMHFDLDAPIMLPPKAGIFTARAVDVPDYQRVPPETKAFFSLAHALDEERRRYLGFDGVTSWPPKFKAREQRSPMWSEIEDAFPIIGGWLAAEREQMEAANGR